ncbi:MAG: dienelactone hydrolase family protein [Pseudomonadota bacterium]|nr:MAG: dienelactone hydrolase family protein [Pseudomonadota bacterium]
MRYAFWSRWTLPLGFAALLVGCAGPQVSGDASDTGEPSTQVQMVTGEDIQARLLWHYPAGSGPHATVIVHPGRGEDALDMRDTLRALSAQGYLAVALDYKRRVRGEFDAVPLPWRTLEDAQHILEVICDNPRVDATRIGVLGFSLGGAHSLLLAASSPHVKAAVVYYPMSDFSSWFEEKSENSVFWRFMIKRWRAKYANNSPNDNITLDELLAFYSPVNHAQRIDAPLLIIHGDRDNTTPLAHSVSFSEKLRAAGNEDTDMMVIKGKGHAFNFRASSEATAQSWNATLSWLDRHLGNPSAVARLGPQTPPSWHNVSGRL